MKTRNITIKIFLFLFMFLVLTSASFGQSSEKPLTFTTATVGGGWYPVGSGIALITNQALGDAVITAVPGPGGTGNPSRVGTGGADIGISYATFLIMAEKGLSPYTEPFTDLRAIASLTVNVYTFLIDPSIPGKTIKDALESGKPIVIASAPAGDSGHTWTEIILEELGYTWDVFSEVKTGGTANRSDWWSDRAVNAMTANLQIPSSAIMQALFSRTGKFLDIDEEVRDTMASTFGYLKYEIPKGTYKDQEEPNYTIGDTCVIFAKAETSENVIYEMTKAIAEKWEYLANVHPTFVDYDVDNMGKDLGISLHPGAIRYYEEAGIEYDK